MTLHDAAQAATARPWSRDGWHVYTGAGMSKRDIAQPFFEADAALIVLAVNHIEALADAAQGVLDSCNPHAKYPTMVTPESLAALQRALRTLDGGGAAAAGEGGEGT